MPKQGKAQQLSLDGLDITRADEIDRQAAQFDKAHPEFWGYFKKFTFELIRRKFRHYGGQGVFERIRWETATPDDYSAGNGGGSSFKVNNNYMPYFSRKFHKAFPQHAGFFRMRHRKSEDQPATHLPELTPKDFDEE